MKKFFNILYVFLYLLTNVKTINEILELDKTETCTLGHIIFNSTNIKEGETLYFKIKSKSITNNYIRYYFLDSYEDGQTINEEGKNLYESNISLTNEEEGLYKVYNFEIIKNLTIYENKIKGNYLIIFYYSNDNLAEISSIKKSSQDKKEDDDDKKKKYYYLSLLIVVFAIIIVIYENKKKRKEKKAKMKEEISNLQKKNQNLEEQKNNEEKKFQDMLTKKEIENLEIEGRLIVINDEKIKSDEKYDILKEKYKEQKEKMKDMKRNQVTIKLSNESDELSIEDKIILKNYIDEVRKNYPHIPGIVSTVKGKINKKNLMHITVQSDDQIIKCIVICQKNDIFNSVINKIYENKPEFKEYKHYFLGNGMVINDYKSIEENNIKDGNGITLNKLENEQ